MELFAATEKLKFFFWQQEMFDVCTTGDTAHIDTILQYLTHTRPLGRAKLNLIDLIYYTPPWIYIEVNDVHVINKPFLNVQSC